MKSYFLKYWTFQDVEKAATSLKWVVLLPTGSTEPHGPHMGLGVDTSISIAAAKRACALLENEGFLPSIAPAVNYGVTECAKSFAGAISIESSILCNYIGAIAKGWLSHGAAHVCLVNNHLEPGHYKAILQVSKNEPKISVSCPLDRDVGKKLTAEYKSGACHAGQYETSIMLACEPSLVDEQICNTLKEVPISLSENLKIGVSEFAEMGLSLGYAGSPQNATKNEGDMSLDILAASILDCVKRSVVVTPE